MNQQIHYYQRFAAIAMWAAVLAGSAGAHRAEAQGVRPTQPTDPIVRARILYNAGNYLGAMQVAQGAREGTAQDVAALLLGRAALEQYRQSNDPADLTLAREALRSVDPTRFSGRDRLDLLIGLAEALYLENWHRPAAALFESALDRRAELEPSAGEQVLDWWATALDRYAQSRPGEERDRLYDEIAAVMEDELSRDPGSATASYWLVVAARGRGDLDRAWDVAIAGWVRAQLSRDHGAALRPDLDRMVTQSLIPERARRLTAASPADADQIAAGLAAEWEQIKAKWTR